MLVLQEPVSTVVKEPSFLTNIANAIVTPVLNFFGARPVFTLFLMIMVVIAVSVANGVRVAWPTIEIHTDRPRWARFLVGFFDPWVGNFWNLLRWISKKFGIPILTPKTETGSGSLGLPDINASDEKDDSGK